MTVVSYPILLAQSAIGCWQLVVGPLPVELDRGNYELKAKSELLRKRFREIGRRAFILNDDAGPDSGGF